MSFSVISPEFVLPLKFMSKRPWVWLNV